MSNAEPGQGFEFEQVLAVGCQREQEQAKREMDVLLARLRVPSAVRDNLGDAERRLLLKYCIEVPLNILWYDRRRKLVERKLRVSYAIIVVCVLVAVGMLAALTWMNDDVVTSQIGTLVIGLGVVMQLLAGSTDTKAQLGSFWRASADLKEGLFTFLHSWEGKACGPEEQGLSPDFEVAIWQELSNARRICREERDAYFATFRSPTEVTAMLTQPLTDVRMRVAEVAAARAQDGQVDKDLVREASFQMANARRALIDAKATVAQRKSRLDALVAAGGAEADVLAAKVALADAESDVVRAIEVLKMQAKADTLN